LKEAVLEFRASTHWFITDGTKRYLTLHIGEGEKVTFIGWHNDSIETRGRLRAKLITHFDELRWRTFASHIGGGSIKHSIWTTAIVKGTGLGVNENLLSGLTDGRAPVF
jgi:hypothetical protein